jgi:hypothetical protein
MNRLATAAAVVAIALLTFFQFPGHTWLQQDSQIYVPILEHLRDPSLLRNDILVGHSHVAFTLYDETARALDAATGLGFEAVLALQQLATRALGVWGVWLMATALGFATGPALLVAMVCSLGATIVGPAVLTIEYEPTPRAFAVPLLVCAVGLVAHRRTLVAGIAGAVAFLYHPPTVLPFWGLCALFAAWPGKDRRQRTLIFAPLLVAAVVLGIAAAGQHTGAAVLGLSAHLTPLEEHLGRMRASYVWISTWLPAVIAHWILLFAVLLAAWARLRHSIPAELRVFVLGLPVLGMLSMPLSWLLLERAGWALMPELQPLRTLLFVALMAQFLTAAAGVRAIAGRRWPEGFAWFALAYLLPLQPLTTGAYNWRRVAVTLALATVAVIAVWLSEHRGLRFAPVLGAAAFFAIPLWGGVVNYPRLHTPELAQLSEWARSSTPKDAVFLFPDAGHGLAPGIFRSEAQRAVYVDWKGGGQVNYLKGFAELWFFRWQQTMAEGFRPADLPRYSGLGIRYVVLQPKNHLAQPAEFENAGYVVYQVP